MLTRYIKNEKGIALILLALSIIVLFGFGALAVDIGHMYNVKNQLQVAADAAALAGAAKLNITADTSQPQARDEAARYAARNNADVAYVRIESAWFSSGASSGSAIPVALSRDSDTNETSGDILIGYWDGNTFTTTVPSGEYANAVKVIARRTGAYPAQPRVQSMFARVLRVLGSNFDFTSISAEAIAARVDKAPILPIAVNEYWGTDRKSLSNFSTISHGGPKGGFYGNDNKYANSFARKYNISGYSPTDSTLVGSSFGVVGQNANDNISNQSVNSYVDLDARMDGFGTWYLVPNNATNCGSCPFPGGVSTNQKYGDYLEFLHYGYPRVPPTAVDETFLSPYPPSPDPTAPLSGTSCSCPWPNVNSFPNSGNAVTIADEEGKSFYEVLTPGSRFVALVYNGAFFKDIGGNRIVTIAGYSVIEIDGYYSGNNPPGWLRNNSLAEWLNKNRTSTSDDYYRYLQSSIFNATGNTGYGHVVPHGVPGTADPYILQRSDASSDCDLLNKIKLMQLIAANKGASRLVGPGIKYGISGTNQY